ncbi:MAG TPA: antibiotic biosynthesis monooxygenase [Rhodospirillales bacterium]|jgi:heme-degrading monooxygenase HmoA
MIAVIFEVSLNPARGERYFELAQALRKDLDKADGFISIERFQSLVDENKFVSLSFWRDRAAVEAWYQKPLHREAQGEGRAGLFTDYRIRVAEVFRDYDMAAGRPAIAAAG